MIERQPEIWEQLGTGGYSALDSALMGLPSFLVEKIGGSDAYKNLKEMRERNKEAALAGDIIGGVGSMFIPGGAIAKGLGAGAKVLGLGKAAAGLGKAAKFMAGTGGKFGQQALRAGANALEQSAARNLIDMGREDEDRKKDFGQFAQGTLTDTALGAGLGGALGTGLSKLSKFQKAGAEQGVTAGNWVGGELKKAGDLAYLKSIGISGRNLQKTARALGMRPTQGEKIENLAGDIADVFRKQAVEGDWSADILQGEYQNLWGKLNEVAKDIPADTAKVVKEGLLGGIADTIADPADLERIGKKLGALSDIDLNKARLQLSNMITKYSKSTSPDDFEMFMGLKKAKDLLDDRILELSGMPPEDLAKAKELFKANKLLEAKKADDLFSDVGTGNVSLNSATAWNQQAADLLKKGSGTGLAGAAFGGTQGETPEERMKNALIYGVGGGVLGAGAKGLTEKVLSTVGKGISKGIGDKLTPELAEAAGSKVDDLTKLLDKAPLEKLGDTRLSGQVATEALARAPGVASDIEPVKEEQAKAQVLTDPKYKTSIDQSLNQMYQQYYSDMDPDEFVTKVREVTGNFDPLNPKTAMVLFSGDQKLADQYLQDIKALQTVGGYQGGGLEVPFLGRNDQDQAIVDALTQVFTRDVGDIPTAEKEAEKWFKMLKEGKVKPDDLRLFLSQDKLKYLGEKGIA